jgi:5-enolpyruvylshikimate-3-phosphate synthase
MSLSVAATVADDSVTVHDVAAVNTSFPGFVDCLGQLGVDIQ